MSLMMRIMKDLGPLNRVFCSRDYDRSIEYLQRILPFKVIPFHGGRPLNGWVIPPWWNVRQARIVRRGEILYDGTAHPLRVIALSRSFRGRVDREELKRHLYFDARYEDAVPYHFRQLYRSWKRDWGFCVTRRFYDSLEPGEYEVVIETEEAPGVLKVLEYTHEGALPHQIVFAAHLDHPGMANDGLSGCAAGVEIMRRLSGRRTRYTYCLVLHQEIIGAEYYLAHLDASGRQDIMEGLFLEMLGTRTKLALQDPPGGDASLGAALARILAEEGIEHRRAPYGGIVVNGEYVWFARGIPMASLSRFPYPQYHCDRDDTSIVHEDALEEAAGLVMRAIDRIEASPVVVKKFTGSICTSNPAYDLYVDPGQIAFGDGDRAERLKKTRLLMELVPSLHRPVGVETIAERVGLDGAEVLAYLERWAGKGLIDLV
ncbi:MAG: DUF4910 domain-containing protein [Desulfomonilia bacterium]|jgi:aminopeptidase-like protein